MKSSPTLTPRAGRAARFTPRVLAAILAAVIALVAYRVAGRTSGSTRHVVVISVDGMRGSVYSTPHPGIRVPNLRRLMTEGSYAEGVEAVYPSVTYPGHTTLVTGRMPAEHGIYTNLSSRQAGKNARDWFWFSKAIKAPTLWDKARQAHLTTASVAWPVTVGAAIDWDVPEIWDPYQKAPAADPLYLARFMNPVMSIEVLAALGAPKSGSDTDAQRTRLAVYLLKQHKPNLLLVHYEDVDDAGHGHGPDSPESAAAVEHIDAQIGEVLTAVKEAGIEETTDVFIVSDHGFLPVHRKVAPNIPLEDAGLLTTKWGGITGGKIATVASGGSFFIYWPPGEDLRGAVDAALKPLREQGLVWGIFDHEALADMGADPDAQLALEAPDGTEYTAASNGALVEDAKPTGTHGFLPYREGLEASFIAWGPEVRAGVDLHRIRMTAIAPTILKALGIDDPKFGDQPPLRDIFK